jgi:protein required for attachment to host cells
MRWILVADASRARLFAAEHAFDLELLKSFEHPGSRARARDLVSDATGRKPAGPSVGGAYGGRAVSHGYGRPGVEPDTEPKAVEGEKFARELVSTLQRGLLDHAFDKLIIAAPPHFLGLLKGELGKEVAKHVEAYVNKDLTQHELRDIQQHIREQLVPEWVREG